jgi:hypothetical protein
MDTNKPFDHNKIEQQMDHTALESATAGDLQELNLDRLYAAWKDDRTSVAPTALREWTAQYPAQADEVMHWTTVAPVLDCAAELSGPEIDRIEERVSEIGRNLIAARRARYSVAATPAFSDIYSAAKARGLNPRTLAARLGVGLAIVAKLQQRLIRYGTLPAALVDRLALELQVSAQQVSDYLRQPASLATGASYKSSGVPQAAAQVDFAEAIRACAEMSEKQKAIWLSENAD